MDIGVDMEILAILLTLFVHVIGAGVLVWALIDSDEADAGSWRDWWPTDGRGPEPPPEPTPPSGGGVDHPVLPDAELSPVRLREPGRIGDHKPPPARRPTHPAVPERERERT